MGGRGVGGVSRIFSYSDTREKWVFLLRCSRLRCLFDNESRHTREKTSGTLGIRMTTCFGRREKPQPELEKRRENKFRNWSIALKITKYIKIFDFIAYKHSWVFSSDILEEDNQIFRLGLFALGVNAILQYFLMFWSFLKFKMFLNH